MSISRSIAEGVNLLSGSARDEYEEFVAGWLYFNIEFAKFLDQTLDDHIRGIYEGLSATDFLKTIKSAGWKPKQGESMSVFDARIKALPIFSQLGLTDGNSVKFIEPDNTSTLNLDFRDDAESRDAFVSRQDICGEHRGKFAQGREVRFPPGDR
jgi:hypothetical protein